MYDPQENRASLQALCLKALAKDPAGAPAILDGCKAAADLIQKSPLSPLLRAIHGRAVSFIARRRGGVAPCGERYAARCR